MVEDVLRHFQFSPSSKCQQQSPPPIHGASTTSATIQQQPPPPVMMGQAGLDTTTNTNHSGEIDDEEHPLRFTFCSEPPPMVWKEQQRAWSGVCMSSCPAAALRARTAHSLMINETEEDDIPQQQQQQNTRHHHVSYHSQSSIPTAASLS
nr:unnamed protein product [Naegleria fowleri]